MELTHKIYEDYYQKPKPLVLTKEEEKEFQSVTICHICEEKLSSDKKSKVRDHCHFTGKYRGAAHNKCNLECRKPLILPVVFHNLQGYDARLFIKKNWQKFKEIFSLFLQLRRSILHFQNLLKLINIIQKKGKKFFLKNSKYVLSILSSFFKNHLMNLLNFLPKIITQLISKISKKT